MYCGEMALFEPASYGLMSSHSMDGGYIHELASSLSCDMELPFLSSRGDML